MADWTERAMERIRQDALKRILAACITAVTDLKKTVSVPAPRRISKTTGRVYAATKATPGAPPRKLTGRGRASISYKLDRIKVEGYVGTNVIYMPVHERRDHKWVAPTMAKERSKYNKILEG